MRVTLRFLVAIAALTLSLAAHAQVTLSLWNFNDENFDVDGGVVGGNLQLIGGVTHEWATGSPQDTASPSAA